MIKMIKETLPAKRTPKDIGRVQWTDDDSRYGRLRTQHIPVFCFIDAAEQEKWVKPVMGGKQITAMIQEAGIWIPEWEARVARHENAVDQVEVVCGGELMRLLVAKPGFYKEDWGLMWPEVVDRKAMIAFKLEIACRPRSK